VILPFWKIQSGMTLFSKCWTDISEIRLAPTVFSLKCPAKSCEVVPAQPVDATPSGIDVFGVL
jgi:hypothetical protein